MTAATAANIRSGNQRVLYRIVLYMAKCRSVLRRSLFPFRKRSLPFVTVDAIIGNQTFSHGRSNIFLGLMYNKATNKFLNSLRKSKVVAQFEFTLEVRERARVTYYRCINYERPLIIIYTLIFWNCVGLAW